MSMVVSLETREKRKTEKDERRRSRPGRRKEGRIFATENRTHSKAMVCPKASMTLQRQNEIISPRRLFLFRSLTSPLWYSKPRGREKESKVVSTLLMVGHRYKGFRKGDRKEKYGLRFVAGHQ